MKNNRKEIYILLFTVILYAILVGTYKGEFWPFSIFPTFSQTEKPWTKALVRDVTDVNEHSIWNEHSIGNDVSQLKNLPGSPVALEKLRISQNYLSNLISKINTSDDKNISELRSLFAQKLNHHKLLIYKVTGKIADRHVVIHIKPLVLLAPDTTFINFNQIHR